MTIDEISNDELDLADDDIEMLRQMGTSRRAEFATIDEPDARNTPAGGVTRSGWGERLEC